MSHKYKTYHDNLDFCNISQLVRIDLFNELTLEITKSLLSQVGASRLCSKNLSSQDQFAEIDPMELDERPGFPQPSELNKEN